MIKFLAVAAAITYAFVVCQANADQSEVVPNITNLKYNEARKALIDAGWQPAITVGHNEELFGQAQGFRDIGYSEINDCAGTGLSPCVFYFKNIYGKKLQVNTLGESNLSGNDFPQVSNYELVDRLPGEESLAAAEQPEPQTANTKYNALITCSMGAQSYNVLACFTKTELKIKSAEKTELYKVYDLSRAGTLTQQGLSVELPEHFELTAQNSHRSLVLGIIIKSLSGETVFTDKVGHYEYISVRN